MSRVPQRRLFFALLPALRTRTALQALALQRASGRARCVPAADVHLTLVFLGNVPEPELPRLCAAAATVAAARVTLVLDQLERWRGGLLCAAGAAPPELLDLYAQLARLARDAGIPVDERPFRAHVTLARDMPRTAGRAAAEPIAPLELHARSFCLMESRERSDGGRYSVLGRWRLDKASDGATQHKPEPISA